MVTGLTNDNKPTLKWIYLAWVGIAFSSLVIGIISAIVQGAPEPVVAKWGISNFSIFAITLYTIGTVLAVILLYYLLKARGLNFKAVGLFGNISLRAILFALAGLVIAFILYTAIEAVLKPVGVRMFWGGESSSALRLSTQLDLILIFVNAVFLGPIVEEIIFRGYVLTAFVQKGQRTLIAVVFSALVFASVHIFIGPGTILFIFFWSFIPAFLTLKFGNLYSAILFHILNNFITYVVFPMWLI